MYRGCFDQSFALKNTNSLRLLILTKTLPEKGLPDVDPVAIIWGRGHVIPPHFRVDAVPYP